MGLQLGAARLRGPSGPREDAIPNLLCRTVNAEVGRAQLFALADRWLPGQQHRRPSVMGANFKLQAHPKIPETDKPVLVIVIDGWGDDQANDFNAVSRAETPCMDSFKKTAPEHWMLVKAHGTAVGLPSDADMGNSEVSSVVERTGTMSDFNPALGFAAAICAPGNMLWHRHIWVGSASFRPSLELCPSPRGFVSQRIPAHLFSAQE